MKTIIGLTILSYMLSIGVIIGLTYIFKYLDFTMYQTITTLILMGIYVKVSTVRE